MSTFEVQPVEAFEPNTAGAWSGVPMDVYQDLPGESNSLLSLLARSPKRYRLTRDGLMSKSEPTHDMELGTMIHSVVNEGVEPMYHLRPDTYPAPESSKKDAPIVDKPWTMQANYCKAWVAERQDKPILAAYEALMINSVTAEVQNNWRAVKLLKGAFREVTACARNPNLDAPYLLRCRFDILGRDELGWYWVETKSTRDASTEAFSREINKRMYHVQCAIYRRIIRRLTGDDDVRCFMMPIEKDAAIPRVNVRQLQPAAMDIGDKVLDSRLELLHQCKVGNNWPALPDEEEGQHIPFIDLPEHAYFDDEEDEISASAEVMR
jgi:hypothetical protein